MGVCVGRSVFFARSLDSDRMLTAKGSDTMLREWEIGTFHILNHVF